MTLTRLVPLVLPPQSHAAAAAAAGAGAASAVSVREPSCCGQRADRRVQRRAGVVPVLVSGYSPPNIRQKRPKTDGRRRSVSCLIAWTWFRLRVNPVIVEYISRSRVGCDGRELLTMSPCRPGQPVRAGPDSQAD